MSDDLRFLVLCVAVATPVGVAVGLYLRLRHARLGERYAAWSAALPWWFFAAGAAFFVYLATLQVESGRRWFAAAFMSFAALDLVAMGMALVRRARPSGEQSSRASP